jgi:ubiquitin-like modifier-activating enzyme ATG7
MSGEGSASNAAVIHFLPPQSQVEPGFWEELYVKKVNEYKLDTSEQAIAFRLSAVDGSFVFCKESFDPVGLRCSPATGVLYNVNTIEEFKKTDKKHLLEQIGRRIVTNISDLSVLDDPAELFRFVLFAFADLKVHQFTYWMGMPALLPSQPFTQSQPAMKLKALHTDAVVAIYRGYASLCDAIATRQGSGSGREACLFPLLFGVQRKDNAWALCSVRDVWATRNSPDSFIVILDSVHPTISSTPADDSTASYTWPMRNLLALLAMHHDPSSPTSPRVIAMRGVLVKRLIGAHLNANTSGDRAGLFASVGDGRLVEEDQSLLLQPNLVGAFDQSIIANCSTGPGDSAGAPSANLPRVVGWEPNERGKMAPKVANLSAMLDSRRLMVRLHALRLTHALLTC